MLKKILFSLGFFTLSACSESPNMATKNTLTSESSIVEMKEESSSINLNLHPKNSTIPNLNDFLDINSRDKRKSLVYWYLANTDKELDLNDYFSIFSPKILIEQNSFEKERMIEEFKNNLGNYIKDVNYYKNLQYFSIPFDTSNHTINENDIIARMLHIYEYDHDQKGFKNMCIDEYSSGNFFPKREEITNMRINLLNKTSRVNIASLCFLPLSDKNKAERIYNLYRDRKIALIGKAYVKLSSIGDPENKKLDYDFQLSNSDTSIFIETLALDIKILQNVDENDNYIKNINDQPILYHAVIGSPKYFH